MKTIKIFDTTLRDGEQSPGCTMTVSEKLELATQLEKMGVDVIEVGFPVASLDDYNAVKTISHMLKISTITALSRLSKKDIDTTMEALCDAKHPRLHLFVATSDLHLEQKLRMTREQVLTAIEECVSYGCSLCDEVEFSCEDASRSDRIFLATAVKTAVKAGAKVINIPDTVGYITPNEMFDLISFIRAEIDNDDIEISTHCHDDLGLSVACSLAAIKAGASQIECTINGIGERAGNAAMEEVVMGIATRPDFYDCKTNIDTKQIYKASRLLSAITGIPVSPNKAIVGTNAFAHESGIHQHGVLMNRNTYEILTPESIGIPQNRLVLGKHSGKHAFLDRLSTLGYKLDDAQLQVAFHSFKSLCDKKKNVTDRDIEALLTDSNLKLASNINYVGFVINSGNTITSTANVRLVVDGVEIEKVAVGDGPIDACFKAIDSIVNLDVLLQNYTIQSVTDGVDALGEVVVKIIHNHKILTGRGLSTDIIEASIKAYLNALNKI